MRNRLEPGTGRRPWGDGWGGRILGCFAVCVMHPFKALNPSSKKSLKKYLYYSLRFLEESASPPAPFSLLLLVGKVGISRQNYASRWSSYIQAVFQVGG